MCSSAVQELLSSHLKDSSCSPSKIAKRRCLDRITKNGKGPCTLGVEVGYTLPSDDIDVEHDGRLRDINCAECGECFRLAAEMVAHGQRTLHRPFGCQHEGCGSSYSKREHLTRHVKAVHVRSSNQSLEELKQFQCKLCHARFTYNHGLTRHMKRSHWNVNLPFECNKCLKRFRKKSELQGHSYVHTGVLPFECRDCGERFLKRFWLTRHQRKHVANKAADTQVYACDCGEIYFDINELESHKETEHGRGEANDDVDNGDDVYKTTPVHLCLVCDQSFARKQYLRAHLRTHFESLDDRKQFTCPMDNCNKSYTRKSNLMTHYNAVHDERKSKRFACPRDHCTARFGYKTVLKHHIESIHDNPKPPKQRERKSAGIFERTLGSNQIGDQVKRVTASTGSKPFQLMVGEEMETTTTVSAHVK